MNQTVSNSVFDLKLFKRMTQSIFKLYLCRWPSLLCLWGGMACVLVINTLLNHYFSHKLSMVLLCGLLCIIVMSMCMFMACWFLLRAYLLDHEAIDDLASLMASQYDQFCGALFYQVGFMIFAYGAVVAYHGPGVIFAFAALIAFLPTPLLTIMAWDNCLVSMRRCIWLCWSYLMESVCLGILPLMVLVLLGFAVQCAVLHLQAHYPALPHATSMICYAFFALPLVLAFCTVLVDYWLQREALAEEMASSVATAEKSEDAPAQA